MMPPPNRRVRTRTHGGGGGVELRSFPLSRSTSVRICRCLKAWMPGTSPGKALLEENWAQIASTNCRQLSPDSTAARGQPREMRTGRAGPAWTLKPYEPPNPT